MGKFGFSYTMRVFFSKDEKDEAGEASGASLHGPMKGLSALWEAPSRVLTPQFTLGTSETLQLLVEAAGRTTLASPV